MAEETRVKRYYITRINTEIGEVEYIAIERFDELPRVRTSIDDAIGFADAGTARRIVNFLNGVNKEIDGKFEYYDTRRDENTFPNTTGLSEEALAWINGEAPVEEEAPVEGDAPVEGEATE